MNTNVILFPKRSTRAPAVRKSRETLFKEAVDKVRRVASYEALKYLKATFPADYEQATRAQRIAAIETVAKLFAHGTYEELERKSRAESV